MGSAHPSVVPYGGFPAHDGTIIIACLADGFWPKLCNSLGCPEMGADPRYATMALRREHRDEIEPRIAAITTMRTVGEWQRIFEVHDVPHAPVLGVNAALSHPHAVARDMVTEVDHQTAGRLRLLGRPIKFPGARQAPLEAPPTLGQHTAEVLRRELGLSEMRIEELRRLGVIEGCAAPRLPHV